MTNSKEILKQAEDRMKKAVEVVRDELVKIRTGKATTALLDGIKIDYYGTMTPLNKVANVSIPDVHTGAVQPWEKNIIPIIEKAILASNLGLNPASDGTVVRVPIPPLNEERRRDLVKLVKKFGEDGKIAIRNVRRDAIEHLKKAEKGAERLSALSGVPPHLPALLKAQKITEKAARVGFDWEHVDQVMAKVMEELHEFEEAMGAGDNRQMEAELGDLLFAIVNLGRFLSINPEEALRKTITRFQLRFQHVEDSLHSLGLQMSTTPLAEMDRLWEEAKSLEQGHNGGK